MPNNKLAIPGYVTVIDAARKCGSSKHFIYDCLVQKRLKGKKFPQASRMVQMVEANSLEDFADDLIDNYRVARNKGWVPSRGPVLNRGYRYIYQPDHHRAMSDGYVAEHYLVAEQILNRPLTKSEVVHHINRNRSDNCPENLIIYESQGEHMSKEHSELRSLFLKISGKKELEEKIIAYIKTLLLLS